jgi:hypothetical protein
MSKFAVALCMVVLVAFIPISASADSAKVRHLANLAIDGADEMLLAAGQLFQEHHVAGQWYPAVFYGDEELMFSDRKMTCSQLIELANQNYENAWDSLLDGKFNKAIRQSHRTIVIARFLVEKAEQKTLASLKAN